jgi:hypothetical protein
MSIVSRRFFGALIGIIAAAALILALISLSREVGYWWRRGFVTRELLTAIVAAIGSLGGILFAKSLICPSEGGVEPQKRLRLYVLGMGIGGLAIALLLLLTKH